MHLESWYSNALTLSINWSKQERDNAFRELV